MNANQRYAKPTAGDFTRILAEDSTATLHGNADSIVDSITIDSRATPSTDNTIFCAIRTAVNDGHRYTGEMYRKGVRNFLVETMPETPLPGATFIVVPSVTTALHKLAGHYGSGTSTAIVTGSTGKSTTKELIYNGLLRHNANVARSPRSYNSFIGSAIARLEAYMTATPETYIAEAGIDAPGQGHAFAESFGDSATTGVITRITDEHDENFDSHESKILEKIDIVSRCRHIVYDNSDPLVGELLRKKLPPATRLTPVGTPDNPADAHALASAAFPDIDFSQIIDCPARISINPGVRGNVLIQDGYTPDIVSLPYALDRARRHATASRPLVLALGCLQGDTSTLAEAIDDAKHRYGICAVIDEENCDTAFADSHILIFGTPGEKLKRFIESHERADHDTTLIVDLDAIVHNFDYFRRTVPKGTGIVAMVKASAYGMGSIEIGKALQSRGAAYLAVAVVDEGVDMRRAGIDMPLMVLNPVTNHYRELFECHLEPAVFSIDELRRLSAESRDAGMLHYPVHIKLDTGMHRVGFTEEMLDMLADELKDNNAIAVRSVFSHLATADCTDMDDATNAQLESFDRLSASLEKKIGGTFARHILNTAGMLRFAGHGQYEMARLGIGLYGISPLPYPVPALRPVAALHTAIISLKHWPAGTHIGYGGRGQTMRPSIIATIPVGYADGINRHLGCGKASFVVNGVECPTIGNICMDQCMIDVTDAPDVAVGDTVEIFGFRMPVERLAQALDTIPYEILTSVSQRVHRTYLTR